MSNFTSKQKELIAAFGQHFGIAANEISLDESGDLFFSLDALNLLTIKLAPDIQALTVSCHSYESELRIVSAHASVTLIDGRHRGCVKSAQVDEMLPSGDKIDTLIQASNIADSRAARAVLRAVGFDPVREFQNFLTNQTTMRELDQGSQLERDRAFIHKVRDDSDMDDVSYRTHLSVATLGKQFSTKDMDEETMSKVATYFRGIWTASQMVSRRAA